MFRFLLTIVASIFILSVVRMLFGALTKSFSEMMSPPSEPGTGPQHTAQPGAGPAGGELKRDPVCGTYIPADNSVRKLVHGETLYFCSPECRDKYV